MTSQSDAGHVLPDVLSSGLDVVFCGTAAGHRSAREGAYYAHPGNRFWRALHQAGFTPRQFAPHEFRQLPALGIGLTDLAKHHAGNDAELPRGAFDAAALVAKIEACAPRMLAFTSKHAARQLLGRVPGYGLQAVSLGATAIYVLPSPSGQASGHWNLSPWLALRRWLEA